MRARAVGAILALVPLTGCAEREPTRAADGLPPNVVVMVLDTLRPDFLGCYGDPGDVAPFLGRLSRAGALFPDAVSTSSWTPPSCASLFTSLDAAAHGLHEGFLIHEKRAERIRTEGGAVLPLNRLPSALPTLPEVFRANGYRTFGITTNMNLGPEMGFDRGFDSFERIPIGDDHPSRAGEALFGKAQYKSATAVEVAEVMESWMDEIESATPFFLYLHFNDVHKPYRLRKPWWEEPPEGGTTLERARAAYRSEVGQLDHSLRRLARRIPAHRPTIFLVISDHGEELGERGRTGHRFGLHWELNRVVFFCDGPGVASAVHPERASLLDVLPTLVGLTGSTDDQVRFGTSLAPILWRSADADAKKRELDERILFAYRIDALRHENWAVLDGRWKLVKGPEGVELFDLEVDPEERRSVLDHHRNVAREMQGILNDYWSRTRSLSQETFDVEIDREQLEALRSLGYAD